MLEVRVRRVGSSLGVLLPKRELDRQGIQEGDTLLVPRLSPRSPKELYGVWQRDPVRPEYQEDE